MKLKNGAGLARKTLGLESSQGQPDKKTVVWKLIMFVRNAEE